MHSKGADYGDNVYTHLFKKTYELVRWIYPTVNRFPKSQRLILSQRIENTSIHLLELSIQLTHRDSKRVRMEIALEVHKLQILMRLSKDLSFLDWRRDEHVSGLLMEIKTLVNGGRVPMAKTCGNLYTELCSFENLLSAFKKARKRKSYKPYVEEFELNLEDELLRLKRELETQIYEPRPLKRFVLRDPKTRVIHASAFRDRVVHHALCNVIEPVFDKTFIHDSYANRKGRGNLAAIERFEQFQRKVSDNGRLVHNARDDNMVVGYVLKADIRHYFPSVDHTILIELIQKRIRDHDVMWLVRKVLDNNVEGADKGMPIGNLTSQLFANIYLNELDYFVKHELKARFYTRYIDDFVILDRDKEILEAYNDDINAFLKKRLRIKLHPEKSRVYPLHKGIGFLGFRMFYHYKLPKKRNIRRFLKKMDELERRYENNEVGLEEVAEVLDGWFAYAEQGDTYKIRKEFVDDIVKRFGSGLEEKSNKIPVL